MKLPNDYELIETEGFADNEIFQKWKKTGVWEIGILPPNEYRQVSIKVKILTNNSNNRNYTFLAEISSQTQEATRENNNMKIGNRVFVIKLGDNRRSLIDTDAPFAGIKKNEVKEIEQLIKNSNENLKIFEENKSYIYSKCIQIIGEKSIREKMVQIVKEDDGERGLEDKNNREYGELHEAKL